MVEKFGFRVKYITQHQFLRVVEFFSEKVNAKNYFHILDIAKTFDKTGTRASFANLFA